MTGGHGRRAVEETVRRLDRGEVRSASPARRLGGEPSWVKKAILLYFRLRGTETIDVGPFSTATSPLKHDLERRRPRRPPGRGPVRQLPGRGRDHECRYVNIGAGSAGNDVATWATVAPALQIGRASTSRGVGIGGVLEPLQARPVIVEDDCFIAPRVVTEGVIVGERAVLAPMSS